MGAASSSDVDRFGPALNRTARLLATAHGGQAVVSLAAAELEPERLAEELAEGRALSDDGALRYALDQLEALKPSTP